MALLTSEPNVTTYEGKVRFAVIESSSFPSGGLVTGATINSEFSIVIVIPFMTGITICRRVREIGKSTSVGVTLRADHVRVFAGQLEGKVVFEVFPEPIHAIVAIETGITICKRMREGKDRVHRTVAGLAGV